LHQVVVPIRAGETMPWQQQRAGGSTASDDAAEAKADAGTASGAAAKVEQSAHKAQ
jgi:hypothetical protein